ncbi:MAG: hypothetical protein VYC17_02035 [Nitrospinota bacterium]|nr:hypothetical protein [Nitrospinota bacterium]
MKLWAIIFICLGILANSGNTLIYAEAECASLKEHPVKLEGWLSKRNEKELGRLLEEFGGMGNTQVILWIYPEDNPSAIMAIGRCVPAYIPQFAIRRALDYTAWVNSLVHQNFLGPNWVGVGTNLFAELARRPVTELQVEQLLDENPTTQ